MKKLKLLLLLVVVWMGIGSGVAQPSISYYSSSMSKIGLGYDFNRSFWSEIRLYGNTTIDNITPELVFCYNIVKGERHNTYAGVGFNVNYFNGPVFPFGVQFSPIEKLNGFSLHIEIQPTFDIGYDVILQTAWGLRYKFGK